MRLNDNRYIINYLDYNKLILVERHFRANGHGFNRDVQFTIIERIGNKRSGKYQSGYRNTRRYKDKAS